MRAELVIKSLLSGSSGLAALVGTNIYPGRIAQNATMPVVAYEMVSGTEIMPITANAGGTLIKSRVQITAFSKTWMELKAIHEAVRKAVLFQSGSFVIPSTPAITVRVIGIVRDLIGPDTREDDLALYVQHVDYQVIHDEV